ncbi:MAG TPA: DUF3592 domain-containing protein [Longimicrobiaceae bacterium]|nr:DUF3592 domain-containing protein [Longimicrobiaceae bacterium]
MAAGLLLVAAVLWAVMAGIALFPSGDGGDDGLLLAIFGALAVGATLVCGGIALRRIRTIRRVFARGAVVQGRVARAEENAENIRSVAVAYRYDGREYEVRSVTELARERGRLLEGQAIDVVVDPDDPSRAFVVAVYVDGA